ncbi:hypothetical protein FACS189411_08330 [Bacteroidia bacterium]|nr:hypothetical protein FACS189411_08330 [Bacteroidia bacterium]
MEVKKQTKLTFLGVEITSVSFNIKKRRPRSLPINIECNSLALVNSKETDKFNVVMDVTVSNEEVFYLTLTAIGEFKVSHLIDEKIREQLININAPAIMFPYVRSFIATLTANIGKGLGGALLIPTQVFKGKLNIKVEEETNTEINDD